ncbi:DUF1302 family protein [Mucilaginibacter sp. UR6-11]|uniref:DUF1302 family protein n=1 Tax=Mucilaginibacter sp. UR6-11 TaxID=1435644 RepID=UPI001E64342E|nr:DUF1302 family protein [Mucilaginibacter sp. UR6-11]MCC8426492.1 hypothetical protein [Mucilaginibacter sp. UR6-11]
MKKLVAIGFIFSFAIAANAQDSTATSKKLTINGYVKNLQTLTFDKDFSDLISGNTIHNRINVKWLPTARLTADAEFRTRLIWGDEVKQTPGFVSLLRNQNEAINMQKIWIENKSLVLLTNVERLYVDYGNDQLNIRVGRQRINWGMATTWNPNDIFNSYNFLDFDYEERPGVDGGRARYLFSSSFNTEIAYANTGKKNGNVAALKYALNKWGYDLQLITGWYYKNPTIGAGWAGSIKDAGFKGEVQYFLPGRDSTNHLNLTLQGDYMFKNGWYVNLGLLFNNRGLNKSLNNWGNLNLGLSPENLMPTKWNIIATTTKELTPLLSANLSILYAPGTNLLILYPSFRYNLATNLDADLVWQSFFAEQAHVFEAVSHICFLRLKWNF